LRQRAVPTELRATPEKEVSRCRDGEVNGPPPLCRERTNFLDGQQWRWPRGNGVEVIKILAFWFALSVAAWAFFVGLGVYELTKDLF
jgi:hypothetical protein